METGCVYKCVYNMSIVNSTQRKMKRKQIKLGIIMLSKISQGERGREREGGWERERESILGWYDGSVKVLYTKSDNLSPNPRTLTTEGENQFTHVYTHK